MTSYRLSPLAEDDLEEIWIFTAGRWSVSQADHYHADIIDALEKLASGERKGRNTDVRPGYLKYAIGRHFVFYRATSSGIDVIRILHQSMDVEQHL